MSEQYEWNRMRVRRDERGKWMCLSNYDDGVWLPLNADTIHTAVAAELDKLYPLPRTVTLDNGDVWERTGDSWKTVDAQVSDWASSGSVCCVMLDMLDRYQNGDAR